MRQREFIAVIGSVGAWPIAPLAGQGERVRRVGALMNIAAVSPEAPGRLAALAQGLAERDCTIGGDIQAEYRWYTAVPICAANMRTSWPRPRSHFSSVGVSNLPSWRCITRCLQHMPRVKLSTSAA